MQGGKDASSPRYINTKLANLTRHIFNKADDVLLDYLNEEGLDIEPVWCIPAVIALPPLRLHPSRSLSPPTHSLPAPCQVDTASGAVLLTLA